MNNRSTLSALEEKAYSALAFGVIGDAMGSPTELMEPSDIEAKFGWVQDFEGDGTDDVVLRDLLTAALVETGGYANADDWAAQWIRNRHLIFGNKEDRFFASILHAAEKLRYGYAPRLLAEGTMPSSTAAMAIAPVGIVNAGHPIAAAAQAIEIASLIHVTALAFCQDAAAAVAAAIARAFLPQADIDDAIAAALGAIRPHSGNEMRDLISQALQLASTSADFRSFRAEYHKRFRRNIACDSRETIPATFAICKLAKGDPWEAVVLAANFGRDTDTIGSMAGGICGALTGRTPRTEIAFDMLSARTRAAQEEAARKLAGLHEAKAKAEIAAWMAIRAQ